MAAICAAISSALAASCLAARFDVAKARMIMSTEACCSRNIESAIGDGCVVTGEIDQFLCGEGDHAW